MFLLLFLYHFQFLIEPSISSVVSFAALADLAARFHFFSYNSKSLPCCPALCFNCCIQCKNGSLKAISSITFIILDMSEEVFISSITLSISDICPLCWALSLTYSANICLIFCGICLSV